MAGITAAVSLEETRPEDSLQQKQQHQAVAKTPSEKGVDTGSPADRHAYFARLQAMLSSLSSYGALTLAMPDDLPPFEAIPPTESRLRTMPTDGISASLLPDIAGVDTSSLRPIRVEGDGNCFPRTASLLCTGTEERHTEMCVRIAHEMVKHEDVYLNSSFLSKGNGASDDSMSMRYAQYSPSYIPGSKLTADDIKATYEMETVDIVRPGAYCGIWQMHALSSLMGAPIHSLYPGLGVPKDDLCCIIIPRDETTRFQNWYVER